MIHHGVGKTFKFHVSTGLSARHSVVLLPPLVTKDGLRQCCCCRVETIDGTAEADKDYTPVKEILVFEKDETSKYVDIQIIDDNEWEPDEIFFVKLSLDSFDSENVAIGTLAIQEITIIDDDGTSHLRCHSTRTHAHTHT